MSRKKNRSTTTSTGNQQAAATNVAPTSQAASRENNRILHNKLTVGEARHLYLTAGGARTKRQIAIQIAVALVVSGLLLNGIWTGKVTIWHVTLPMIGEYLAYLLSLPLLALAVRHPELTKPAWQCARLMGTFLAIGVGATIYRADQTGLPWLECLKSDTNWIADWLVQSGVHWPIAIAALYSAFNARENVQKLQQFGPPFLGAGMGCAMRLLVFFLALVLVPALGLILMPILDMIPSFRSWANSLHPDWATVWTYLIWAILLAAELTTVWFHWDIQQRLAKAGLLPKTGVSDKES